MSEPAFLTDACLADLRQAHKQMLLSVARLRNIFSIYNFDICTLFTVEIYVCNWSPFQLALVNVKWCLITWTCLQNTNMNNRLWSKFSQLGAHLARLPLSMARHWQNWQHALRQRQDTGNKGSTNTGNNGKSQCPKWGRWGSKRDGDRSDALDPRKVKCDQCKVSLHQVPHMLPLAR